jgi:lipopolysaccharide transport system ATP-binding protein
METLTKGAAKTVIFVSHNLDAVLKLCPKAILLQNGNCTHLGDTSEVIETYLKNGNGQNRYDAPSSSKKAVRSI